MRHLTPFAAMPVAVLAACQASSPSGLSLEQDPTVVSVEQRSTAFVPGSEDELVLRIGDVTGGQVIVSLEARDGRTVLPPQSMREGDSRTFRLPGGEYALGLARLANFLFDGDFAEFHVGSPSTVGNSHVERLFARLEASKLTFVRNGREHTGKEAAEHIRRKFSSAGGGGDLTDREAFIARFATKSSLTDEPYFVRLATGREVRLAEWLRQPAPFEL